MLKVAKVSSIVVIFYILFYSQIWGDIHLILYGSAAVSVLSIVLHCMRTGSMNYENVPYGIWNNLILVVYAVVTGFFVSVDFSVTLRSSITLLAFSAICIVISYASAEEGSFEWVLKALVALALLCSLYTLLRGVELRGYGITMSATNNPHSLGAVLNLGIFAVAYLSQNREQKFSLFSAALIVLFMIVTILCGSRKFLLANVLLIGIWAWAVVREEWTTGDTNRRIIVVMLLMVFAGVAYTIVRNVYMSSGGRLRMQDIDDMGNQSRILFYERAWKIFLDYPLFGGGYNQFYILSGTGSYAHSTYAEAIADLGFVGCVLYFAPFVAVTYRIFSKVLHAERNYGDYLLFAFCLSELFIGAGQIFFMEFSHFLSWSILFFYDQPAADTVPEVHPIPTYAQRCKYIR